MMKSHVKIFIPAFFTFFIFSGAANASPTLKNGSTGQEVLVLQKKLQSVGYNISEADGVFGEETEKAVENFQRDKNIRITGIVTNATWRALQKAKNGEKEKTKNIKGNSDSSNLSLVPSHKTFLSKDQAKKLVRIAEGQLGVPYVFGGTDTGGFDCSGYLQYVFAQLGLEVPRLADDQYNMLGITVPNYKKLVKGDLVFFSTYESGASHCGIYLDDGRFIHASSSRGVAIDEISDSYWKERFIGGKHIVK